MTEPDRPETRDPSVVSRTHQRFGALCAIGRLLAGFEDVARTVSAVLAEAQRILPLRSAVVIELEAHHATTSLWHDAAVTLAEQRELSASARAGLDSLDASGLSAADRESIASTTTVLASRSADRGQPGTAAVKTHFIVLPLVAPAFAVIGAVQFEFVGEDLEEEDLACASAIVNQLAVALEVHRSRLREAALASRLHETQKAQAVATLVGGVAHYFNNLLTVILGHTEMLLVDRGSVEDTREALTQVHDAGERVVALTRQLLSIGRQQYLVPQIVDINALINAMSSRLVEIVGRSGLGFTLSLSREALYADVDPAQLEVVIAALVLNAREAIGDTGSISIETSRAGAARGAPDRSEDAPPGEYIAIRVTDSGGGVAPAIRARMFEPFFSTKDPGLVAGLGLAVVDGIVGQSGGFIDVASEAGRGTTITVSLPAVQGAVVQRKTILVVEADPSIRELILSALPSDDFILVPAPDWDAAIDACVRLQGKIDVVVLGCTPLGDDIEVRIHRLRLLRPAVRIVVISSCPGQIELPTGRAGIGLAVLGKAFTAAELSEAVRNVL